MLLTGIMGFVAQFVKYFTQQRSHPAVYGLIVQSGVVYSILIDRFWFQLYINFIQVIGIAILFLANLILILKNMSAEREA